MIACYRNAKSIVPVPFNFDAHGYCGTLTVNLKVEPWASASTITIQVAAYERRGATTNGLILDSMQQAASRAE